MNAALNLSLVPSTWTVRVPPPDELLLPQATVPIPRTATTTQSRALRIPPPSQPNRRDHTAQKWPCVNKGGFTPLRGRATMPRHFGPVPEDGPVKPKTLGLVAALVALPTAAAVIPGRLAGATAPAQRAGASSSQTA